jgi:ribosomal protein S18 acetylase RimI-like enzyme
MAFGIRDATLADAPSLATLHVRAFRETHGGGPGVSLRLEQWRSILAGEHPQDFTILVQTENAELVGFGRGVPHDGGVPGFEGELNKIYVLRSHQGRGLGRLLVCRIAGRFLSRGVDSMLLFGDARSPSNGFYEHLGAERLVSPLGEFHGAYGWNDLQSLMKVCGDVPAG